SGGIKGYDGGKQVKGRKRHVLVDTLGLLLSVEVTPANTSDQAGARRLLIGLKPLQPRLELIWADGSYSGEPLATWGATEGAWRLEIIKPTPHVQGFVVRPWCWIVERTLGWLGRQRRLSKDYEHKLQTSETLLKLAMIRLMLRRLARSPAGMSKHALNYPLHAGTPPGLVSVAGPPAPRGRVVLRRSRRYNALATGGAGAGDVPCPRMATRTRRHAYALRRQ